MIADTRLPPEPIMSGGHLHAEVDDDRRIIRVFGRGFCSQQDSNALLASLKDLLVRQRARGPVRVLCDMREVVAQSADLVQQMQVETAKLYSRGDRVAVLFSSSLFERQLKRSVVDDLRRLFVSEDEAREWLSAD